MKKVYASILSFFTFLFLNASVSHAGLCALCRRSLEQSGNAGLMKGFYWSIVIIAGLPLIIMSVAVTVIRRAEKRRLASRLNNSSI